MPTETQTDARPTGVVLMNLGGPDRLDAVEPFLFNLFSDPDVIPLPLRGLWIGQRLLAWRISSTRAPFARGYYEQIGGRSPIAEITAAQASALERRLGAGYRCYVAMRCWHPFTDEAIDRMVQDRVGRVVALSLYPHYTKATTGSSLVELRRRLRKRGGFGEPLEIESYPDDPGYLDALATQVRTGLASYAEVARPSVTVLFSAHGLPRSFIRRGDPYVEHTYLTIAGVMARLAATDGRLQPWRLAYQSRVGKDWLDPGTETALATLAEEAARGGSRDVLIVPISFVSDHVETLYEIDHLFAGEAARLGLVMHRAPSLNDHPQFIDALAGLVERRVARATATPAAGPGIPDGM